MLHSQDKNELHTLIGLDLRGDADVGFEYQQGILGSFLNK